MAVLDKEETKLLVGLQGVTLTLTGPKVVSTLKNKLRPSMTYVYNFLDDLRHGRGTFDEITFSSILSLLGLMIHILYLSNGNIT